MLPAFKTGTTFPTFQSHGKAPVDNDCVNNRLKHAADICLVFFRIFEMISSTPEELLNLFFSMIDSMPSVENTMGGICDDMLVDSGQSWG